MKFLAVRTLLALLAIVVPASSQTIAPEIVAVRARVAAIRAGMAQVTATAEYAANIFTNDSAARFLISSSGNRGLAAEFSFHSGASPEMRDADESGTRGIVLLTVSAWETDAFGIAMMTDRFQETGRPVIVIGSSAGKPQVADVRHLVPNGAPDGARTNRSINEIANLIATWTMYAEFVGAATRQNWEPGILVSFLVPNADDSNYRVKFRTPPSGRAVTAIPAGQLGAQFLDRIDSLLNVAAQPAHQALMQRAADSLRAVRASGHRVFVAACGNYLQQGVVADSIGSPFQPVLAQYQLTPALLQRGASNGDAMVWFGYHGYDCPHIQASSPLQEAGIKVVSISDNSPPAFPANVMVSVPLAWRLPENIGKVPFNAEGVGSASSVEALLHYVWMRRLLGQP
jgi:hypothetical protein